MRKFVAAFAFLTILSGFALSGGKSQAALVEALLPGTDCAGFFNPPGTSGFGACTVFVANGETIELSPVVAKFDNEDNFGSSLWELNTAEYPTIDGSEFSITGQNSTTGTWTYTPGAGDPAIKYWAVQAGNQFLLSWIVTDATALAACTGDATSNANYNLTCLLGAEVVSAADWRTSVQQGISHITFYDTEPPQVVPLPAAIWLFLSAFGAFFGFRHWKGSRSVAQA